MRLLIITRNDSPDHASFRQRILVHLDALRAAGIECNVVRLPRGIWDRRRLFASARRYDAVLLHRKLLNASDEFWMRRFGVKVVFEIDDAMMYSDRKPFETSRIRFGRLRRTMRRSELVIAGNTYLAEHAQRYGVPTEVLPTGLDLEPYRVEPPQRDDETIRLVWIGSGSTLVYLREIRPALEELGRRWPHIVLRIICSDFLDLDSMQVEKKTWSRDTEAIDLMTSDIGLAPLPDNPFTRGKCGFKILQYQAAGLPVVASPVGVNAEYVRDGVTGCLVRNHREWVEAISGLIEDSDRRKAMGQAGRRDVEAFDVHTLSNRFYALIAGYIESNRGPAGTVRPGDEPPARQEHDLARETSPTD